MKSFCQRSTLHRYYYHSYNTKPVCEPCLCSLRSCKSAATPRKSMQPLVIVLCRAGKEGTSGLNDSVKVRPLSWRSVNQLKAQRPREPLLSGIFTMCWEAHPSQIARVYPKVMGRGSADPLPKLLVLSVWEIICKIVIWNLSLISPRNIDTYAVMTRQKQSSCVIPHESRN